MSIDTSVVICVVNIWVIGGALVGYLVKLEKRLTKIELKLGIEE